MTATRIFPDPTTHPSPPGVGGGAFGTLLKTEGDELWNRIITPVGTIGGTGNAITGVCSPVLAGALVDGQTFRLTTTAANTGAVTVRLDGGSIIDLRDKKGNALASGDIASGESIDFFYDAASAKFRMSSLTSGQVTGLVAGTGSWEQFCDLDLSAGVGNESFTFTADRYSLILVQLFRASPNSVSPAPAQQIILATGGTDIVTLSSPVYSNAANFANLRTEFDIDNLAGTKLHQGRLVGSVNSVSFTEVKGHGSHATSPDRFRVKLTQSKTHDAGHVRASGLIA